MAYSPWKISHPINASKSKTNPTSRPITMLLFQAWDCPPYCRAIMKLMMQPIAKTIPKGSICKNFSFQFALSGLAAGGVWKNIVSKKRAAPPRGKLI